MRDFASCLSEYAVGVVSDASCSSSYSNKSCISPNLIPSLQIAVACLYKIILPNENQLLITITWCKNNTSQGLNITFGDDTSSAFKLNTNSRFFRKKKGTKSLESNNSKCEIIWDLCAAQYKSGPEPVRGYYLCIIVDSEVGLVLGDMAQEKLKNGIQLPKFSLVSRREHFSGNTHYSTKAQFCETGILHDILIRCSSGENEGLKYPVLWVCIDKKMVIRVKRVHLNFRGNESILVDGLWVDLFWDVHDWFFNPGSGYAVFMFRTRGGMDSSSSSSRLWLEEKKDEQQKVDFSLLIYAAACNTHPLTKSM